MRGRGESKRGERERQRDRQVCGLTRQVNNAEGGKRERHTHYDIPTPPRLVSCRSVIFMIRCKDGGVVAGDSQSLMDARKDGRK